MKKTALRATIIAAAFTASIAIAGAQTLRVGLQSDVDTLEDLVTAAVRQALQAAKELREREMGKVTGGLNLPGMGL